MVWGKMILESNGLSYVDFKVHVDVNKAVNGVLNMRSVQTHCRGMVLLLIIYIIFSTPLGTWVSGIPTKMEFEKGMENEIAMPKKKRVYKIVSVIQPPFMQWNETLRKHKIQIYFPTMSKFHVLESSFIVYPVQVFLLLSSLFIFGSYLKLKL